MIIAKPDHCILKWDDLQSNCKLDSGNYFFTISYSSFDKNNPTVPPEPLGFMDIGNDIDYLKSCVDWLNENQYSAIIYCSLNEANYIRYPIFFGYNQYCLHFEGEYDLSEEIYQKFEDLKKYVDNPTVDSIMWMFKESLSYKNEIFMMDNESRLYSVNTYHKYEDNGIFYSIFGKPSKYSTSALPHFHCHS